MLTTEFALPPLIAVIVFVVAVVAGHQYRKSWKSAGPAWRAWLFGAVAALCLLIVAFAPLRHP